MIVRGSPVVSPAVFMLLLLPCLTALLRNGGVLGWICLRAQHYRVMVQARIDISLDLRLRSPISVSEVVSLVSQ